MEKTFSKILTGYKLFREKYVLGDKSILEHLSNYGQQPKIMVVACCDSRVDPALILQCDPGDLFVVRNVANIVPPYEKDEKHHGTSAALEFGICNLEIKNLILLGHSQCGGINALITPNEVKPNDFISNWVSIIKKNKKENHSQDEYSKLSLKQSYANCLSFPWIKQKLEAKLLKIHLWFFDIKTGQIYTYNDEIKDYIPLKVL